MSHSIIQHNGFVVFCEKKLRYEKGPKAWIFLGPYVLGILALEVILDPMQPKTVTGLWNSVIFFAYIVLFPSLWRRVLKRFSPTKVERTGKTSSSAVESP